MTEEELDLLLAQDPTIPHEAWGIKTAKTRDDMLEEVNEDEAVLQVTLIPQTGQLGVLRDTHVHLISVYFTRPDGVRLMLMEQYHRLANGFVFSRADEMNASVSEKGKKGETNLEITIRALAEELGITDLTEEEIASISLFSEESFTFTDPRNPGEIRASRSYPGIWTRQKITRASVELSARHFKPGGYIEPHYDKQGKLKKTVEFAWMTGKEASEFLHFMRQTKAGAPDPTADTLKALLTFLRPKRKKKDP